MSRSVASTLMLHLCFMCHLLSVFYHQVLDWPVSKRQGCFIRVGGFALRQHSNNDYNFFSSFLYFGRVIEQARVTVVFLNINNVRLSNST